MTDLLATGRIVVGQCGPRFLPGRGAMIAASEAARTATGGRIERTGDVMYRALWAENAAQ
ncbi:MAG: hypothetical protein MJE77_07075 [Proteobacteria bacterium]|nr:hypothetical protein [Pseudomonadota bacterium]